VRSTAGAFNNFFEIYIAERIGVCLFLAVADGGNRHDDRDAWIVVVPCDNAARP
jgi:hypothetical protein